MATIATQVSDYLTVRQRRYIPLSLKPATEGFLHVVTTAPGSGDRRREFNFARLMVGDGGDEIILTHAMVLPVEVNTRCFFYFRSKESEHVYYGNEFYPTYITYGGLDRKGDRENLGIVIPTERMEFAWYNGVKSSLSFIIRHQRYVNHGLKNAGATGMSDGDGDKIVDNYLSSYAEVTETLPVERRVGDVQFPDNRLKKKIGCRIVYKQATTVSGSYVRMYWSPDYSTWYQYWEVSPIPTWGYAHPVIENVNALVVRFTINPNSDIYDATGQFYLCWAWCEP